MIYLQAWLLAVDQICLDPVFSSCHTILSDTQPSARVCVRQSDSTIIKTQSTQTEETTMTYPKITYIPVYMIMGYLSLAKILLQILLKYSSIILNNYGPTRVTAQFKEEKSTFIFPTGILHNYNYM